MATSVATQPKWQIGYGIVDFLVGLPLFITAPLYRRWHMRWGAVDSDVAASSRTTQSLS